MRAWSRPVRTEHARSVLGDAPSLTLYDDRSGTVRDVTPAGDVRLYVCGITPYDATHIGHAATYVAFDLAVRAWTEAGHRVHYVQNVTDVDDPLLQRAAETGEDWAALAERETELFRTDMEALAVVPPDHFVGAVEAIPIIVDLVEELGRREATYRVDDDLYFPIAADPQFGSVSRLGREEMLALFPGRGGDPDRAGKRDPLDPLLWRRQREGEPAWPTALGPGRPGWHVECTAIARHYLGAAFDVQGGGSDLSFPHHEMSASHAHVADPAVEFAKAYVHAGMVGYRGEKMSKSLGNLVLVSALRADDVDPRAIRLALLGQYYRADWEWTDEVLDTGLKRLSRWSEAVKRGGPDAGSCALDVRAALADDLDAPRALAAVDAWTESGGHVIEGAADLVRAVVADSLGVSL